MNCRLPITRVILCLTLGISLHGCSATKTRAPEVPRELSKISLDLFAARGFLGGSDYEHYTIKDGLLWRECGSVSPKKKLEEGDGGQGQRAKSLSVRQKRLESLRPEEQFPIVSLVNETALVLAQEGTAKLPKPESVRSISDGGIFEVSASTPSSSFTIATNVDAVSEPKDVKLLKKLNELFAKIRLVGPVICDSQTFFGIGRK